MLPQDLFEDHTAPGLREFEDAWAAWVEAERRAGRLRRDSSISVYASMWSALARWCLGNRVKLAELSESDLDAFLRSRGGNDEISARHGWRFVRLVERVLGGRGAGEGQSSAPEKLLSRPDLRWANASERDPLPSFLPAGQARRLVAFLSAVRPGRAAAGQTWQEVRNRTSVALMLGAGLAPGEVRALKVADAVAAHGHSAGVPWKIQVPAQAESPARETPIAPWAGQLLAYWLRLRSEQGIPGQTLFPSTRTGKGWSKVSQYNATKEVLQAAGVDDVDGGSFRLRHTFALRQLRKGKNPADVARWLGVKDPAVMARYQRILPAPADVI